MFTCIVFSSLKRRIARPSFQTGNVFWIKDPLLMCSGHYNVKQSSYWNNEVMRTIVIPLLRLRVDEIVK